MRQHSGTVWGGTEQELSTLVNPADIGKLVLFDTWTRNCDRHPPDPDTRKPNRNNVFLSNEGLPDGQWRLMAMDHTHCFNCGRDLNAQLSHIDLVQDERMFGLFPEFLPAIRANRSGVTNGLARLATLDRSWLEGLVAGLPAEWDVDSVGRTALVMLLLNRAQFVYEAFSASLEAQIGPPSTV